MPGRAREQQDAGGLEGGRPQDHGLGLDLVALARLRIGERHPRGLARGGVDHHLAHHRVRAQGEAARVLRGIDETGGRIEGRVDVAAARPAVAGSATEASAAVLVVLQAVGGDPGAIGREHAVRALHRLAQHHLRRVQPGRALELAVGQVLEALGVAGDAEVEVDLVVVGGDVGVGDGPVLAEAVAALRLEVVVGKAEGQAAPDVGLAPQAAGPHPGVLRARVGVVLLVHHDVLRVVGAAPALHVGVDGGVGAVLLGVGRIADRVLVLGEGVAVVGHLAATRVVVGPLHRLQLRLDVELLPRLEHQHLEALLGEDVSGHASRGPRAHHDGVVGAGQVDFFREWRGYAQQHGRHPFRVLSGRRVTRGTRAGTASKRQIRLERL